MLIRLLLLFTLVPLIEFSLLAWITTLIGLPYTIALVIFTGVVGAWLARQEGLRVLQAVQERMSRGELPADSLVDGLLILVAGAVLITPGVLTDLLGFGLLVPPIRKLFRQYLIERFKSRIVVHPMPGSHADASGNDDVIDSEFRPPDDTQE